MKTKNISNGALQALIEFTNDPKNIGSKIELTRRLGEALGKPVHRQIVETWVHPDPEKRTEPKLGLGLLLVAIGAEMIEGKKGPVKIDVSKLVLNGARKKVRAK